MAKFDIYKYKNPRVPIVLEVQADLLEDLETTVVVPLILQSKFKSRLFKRLTPILEVDNEKFVMITTDIATVKRKDLEHYIGNIASDHEYDVTNALDFLMQGF